MLSWDTWRENYEPGSAPQLVSCWHSVIDIKVHDTGAAGPNFYISEASISGGVAKLAYKTNNNLNFAAQTPALGPAALTSGNTANSEVLANSIL